MLNIPKKRILHTKHAKRNQNKTSPGLKIMKHNKVEPKFAVCINNEDYIVSTISPNNEELEGSPINLLIYLSYSIFHSKPDWRGSLKGYHIFLP